MYWNNLFSQDGGSYGHEIKSYWNQIAIPVYSNSSLRNKEIDTYGNFMFATEKAFHSNASDKNSNQILWDKTIHMQINFIFVTLHSRRLSVLILYLSRFKGAFVVVMYVKWEEMKKKKGSKYLMRCLSILYCIKWILSDRVDISLSVHDITYFWVEVTG